jgi:hypothetical protein
MHDFLHECRLFDFNVSLCYYTALFGSLDLLCQNYMKWNNEGNGNKMFKK